MIRFTKNDVRVFNLSVSPLYQLIQQIEYGTRLHIGVLFFKSYGNSACVLPHRHEIHQSPLCDGFKSASRNSYFRCVRCRNLAVEKALTEKQPFGGLCVNGIYEYTHPVVINGDVAAIIFIGNILDRDKGLSKIQKQTIKTVLSLDTLEPDFSKEQCQQTAETIDRYIRFLLEKYSDESPDEKPLIKNIKCYIDDNLEFGLDIRRIAAAFHYNSRYLCRLFKKETHMALGEYILSQRLKRAQALLLETSHSVIEISTEVGFNNVTYFNKLFKSSFGITPTAYRKQDNQ